MELDFSEFFNSYEKLVTEVDAVFERVSKDHQDCVTCGRGCSDCCYAMFDVTLVEALYINHHFNRLFSGLDKTAVLDRADEADRAAYRFKRQIFKASQQGTSTQEIMAQVASQRLRCPLLNDDEECVLYDHRPITCRLYGIPTAIGGQSHTCGKSGFAPGEQYPTVNIDVIQDKLMLLSGALAESVNSKHVQLGEMLVPVSMALLTEYDAEYLGVKDPKDDTGMWTLGQDGSVTREGTPCQGCATSGDCDSYDPESTAPCSKGN